MYETVVVNLGASTRTETLEGRKYLVAPMVMITHGVHKGSAGALYYPEAELSKSTVTWNHKPGVVYHPEQDGKQVSACTPEQIEKRKVGLVLNTRWDAKRKKLRAEAWIDVEKANAVDPRLMESVANGKMMEVSTGLVVDAVYRPGTHNGKKYDYVATNLRPDHLAFLPDQKGACSIADGAGLLQLNVAYEEAEDGWASAGEDVFYADPVNKKFPIRNQADVNACVSLLAHAADPTAVRNACVAYVRADGTLTLPDAFAANGPSFSDTMDMVSKALAAAYGEKGMSWRGYVVDLFPSSVVFAKDYRAEAGMFKVGYAVKDGMVSLSGDPVPVTRAVVYRTQDGKLVDNLSSDRSDTEMDKKAEHITKLIGNGYTEADREFLTKLDEADLLRIKPVPAAPAPQPTPANNAAPIPQPTPVAPKQMTQEEYIANAPPEMRQMLVDSLAAYNAEKAAMIDVINKAPGNVLTVDQLNSMDINVLRAMFAVVPKGQPAPGLNVPRPIFTGQNVGNYNPPAAHTTPKGGTLKVPKLDYSKK